MFLARGTLGCGDREVWEEKRSSTARRHSQDMSWFTCCTVTFSTSQGGKCDREIIHWHMGRLLLQSRWRPQSWRLYWAHTHTHTEKKNLTMAGLNVFAQKAEQKLEGDAGLAGFQWKPQSSLRAFCTASHLFCTSKVCSLCSHVWGERSAPDVGVVCNKWKVSSGLRCGIPQGRSGETGLLIAHAGKESSNSLVTTNTVEHTRLHCRFWLLLMQDSKASEEGHDFQVEESLKTKLLHKTGRYQVRLLHFYWQLLHMEMTVVQNTTTTTQYILNTSSAALWYFAKILAELFRC